MSEILSYIVNILLYLFLKACCHYNNCNYSSPYFRWFQICWTAKVSSGKIAWNEFLALFEYFALHESRGERYMLNNYYLKLVDMSPFIYDIPEEEWEKLACQIYMGKNKTKTVSKPKQSRKKTTKKRKKNETII